MKATTLFKILIDGLFLTQLVGIIDVVFNIPFGVLKINQNNIPVEMWGLIDWAVFILSIISYVLFIIALYHLRKISRHLLSDNYFTVSIINSLKKSGYLFIYSGILTFAIFLLDVISRIFHNKLELLHHTDFMICLLIATVGFFFLIQSKALLSAKELKQENDLTI